MPPALQMNTPAPSNFPASFGDEEADGSIFGQHPLASSPVPAQRTLPATPIDCIDEAHLAAGPDPEQRWGATSARQPGRGAMRRPDFASPSRYADSQEAPIDLRTERGRRGLQEAVRREVQDFETAAPAGNLHRAGAVVSRMLPSSDAVNAVVWGAVAGAAAYAFAPVTVATASAAANQLGWGLGTFGTTSALVYWQPRLPAKLAGAAMACLMGTALAISLYPGLSASYLALSMAASALTGYHLADHQQAMKNVLFYGALAVGLGVSYNTIAPLLGLAPLVLHI